MTDVKEGQEKWLEAIMANFDELIAKYQLSPAYVDLPLATGFTGGLHIAPILGNRAFLITGQVKATAKAAPAVIAKTTGTPLASKMWLYFYGTNTNNGVYRTYIDDKQQVWVPQVFSQMNFNTVIS